MKILNIRQHSDTKFTATILNDAGKSVNIGVAIDYDGTIFFNTTALLRCGGYKSNPISAVRNFIARGMSSLEKRSFVGLPGQCYAVTEKEADVIIATSRVMPNHFADTIHEVARQIRNITISGDLFHSPEPAPEPTTNRVSVHHSTPGSLSDQAAGIVWLTEILADTTLPYDLHEQALRTRAGLLTIQKTLQEIA